jgi:acetyl esterase/lipase
MILQKLFSRKSQINVIIILTFLLIFSCQQLSANITHKQNYQVFHDIVYQTVSNRELKLDLYKNQKQGLHPTLLVIHGGGWIKGQREDLSFFAPYLDWGFSIANIEYRLASDALAPAAVEDSICALHWVIKNAKNYNFDTNKIVVTGFSAGGHLALMTGITPSSSQFDRKCRGKEKLKVAAIVNWSGITDVSDLLRGSNQKDFAVQWFGNKTSSDEIELAKKVSPINFVRPGLPPILTIHGEKDNLVPYAHAVRLHEALDKVSVSNQLFTVFGAEHGDFTKEQKQQIYRTIKEFLTKQGVID